MGEDWPSAKTSKSAAGCKKSLIIYIYVGQILARMPNPGQDLMRKLSTKQCSEWVRFLFAWAVLAFGAFATFRGSHTSRHGPEPSDVVSLSNQADDKALFLQLLILRHEAGTGRGGASGGGGGGGGA